METGMKSSFKDYFSKQSDVYLKARPTYPDELFSFLAAVSPAKELAWDGATGNGQAASSLVDFFGRVIASDASEQQIANAIPHPRIVYKVALAEDSDLEDETVDLVTVASGIHWLQRSRFYEEVSRVLKPNGVIGVWAYTQPRIAPDIDVVIRKLASGILEEHWPREVQLLWNEYRDLHFPFHEIDAPRFHCIAQWDLSEMKNHLASWSGSQRYADITGRNPVDFIDKELSNLWGSESDKRTITWPVCMRIGKKR
jgi:ubiquinone/menaquinone biosynthesis C-methylase UbiE